MNVVGRRFWTWMGVWALSFFVKGDLLSSPQEKPASQVTEGTSNTRHKVPRLKTATGKVSPGLKTQGGNKPDFKLSNATSKVGKVTSNISSGGDRPTESLKTLSSGGDRPTESLKTASKTHAHKTPKHPK